MMKKTLYIILFFFVFVLLGCEGVNNSKSKLDQPILSVNDNYIITWDDIEGADYYKIYLDDDFWKNVYNNQVNLSDLENGTYDISVQACSLDKSFLSSTISNLSVEINKEIIIPIETERPDAFNVFMINDTHGAFVDGDFPGMGRIGTILEEIEADGETIKIMNGDAFQGSYESNMVFGRSILDCLNELAFDAFVIGNHEFDWGLDVIRQYKDGDLSNGEANFPFLGANIIDKKTNKMVDFLEPYFIKEIEGLKVGIIGIIGYNQESSILTPYVEDYEFIYPLDLIKQYSYELRVKQNCDYVLVSVHDYDDNLNNALAALNGNNQIDAILCGHTHQYIVEEKTNGSRSIPIVQNRSQNQTAICIEFDVLNNTYNINTYYPWDYPNAVGINSIYNQYQYLIEEANTIIGYTNSYLNKNSIGQIATTSMKNYFNADIAIINTAGVRNTISRGNITKGNVFTVFPFNNQVIEVDLKGSDLLALYNENSDYLYVSSFNFNTISANKIYHVVVIDYVFYSPYYKQFKNIEFTNTQVLLRDIILEYFDEYY